MSWIEEDEEFDFEWKEEDEDEIAGESAMLSRIRLLATVVFIVLLLLGLIYFVLRVAGAFREVFA